MQKRSPRVRTALLLLAGLQFMVPGAAAWADARLGASEAGPAHIESHSTAVCVRIHPADCALHRFLSAPLATGRPVVFRVQDARGTLLAPRSHAAPPAALAAGLHHSRAPPPLS
ncbi:MAG TPA: hypothetical protein VN908_00075 [Gemmatimonadales bacterium]|nr:hypothetical protein [Gemmatimonadales bacterium]